MTTGSALAAVLRSTTLDALRSFRVHDAIVIGAGAAGGLAALLLSEAGLRVLVLNAGNRPSPTRSPARWITGNIVRQLSDPSVLKFIPPSFAYKMRGPLKVLARQRQPIQSQCYAWERAPNAFVDDVDCPYTTPPDRPFIWFRSRQLGGRMTIPGHGRQYYRFSIDDFVPQDGLSSLWPIRPSELDSWYAMIERRLRLAGAHENSPWVPDGELSSVISPTAAEANLSAAIGARWPGAPVLLGRYAAPLNALEQASLTGRLLVREGAIAREIEVDDSGKVRGVLWIDQESGTEERATAPLIFVCASALESTRLLLLSRSPRNPQGIGAGSGVLGRFLMDHIMIKAEGVGPELPPGIQTRAGRTRAIMFDRFQPMGANPVGAKGGNGFHGRVSRWLTAAA
jgi:choline dehydrogenase-like flavoprotein